MISKSLLGVCLVSFIAMNVFGRGADRNSHGGRDHNQHLAVMVGSMWGLRGDERSLEVQIESVCHRIT